MTNLRKVDFHRLDDEDGTTTFWRPFGDVVAGLTARIEAKRAETAPTEETHFVPMAWAAE